MKKIMSFLIAMAVVSGMWVGAANATLITRTGDLGENLIYDSDLGITWYDFSNSADTWANQVAWADGLTITVGGIIYDDWRLPNTVDAVADLDLALFENLQDNFYWSGTEVEDSPSLARVFQVSTDPQVLSLFSTDPQFFSLKLNDFLALAVRSGDVAASDIGNTEPVPEPSTIILLSLGLAGAVLYRRRTRRQR